MPKQGARRRRSAGGRLRKRQQRKRRYRRRPGDSRLAGVLYDVISPVLRRLEKLSDERVLAVAKAVVRDHPDDRLQGAIETLVLDGRLVSDVTRHNLAEALNGCELGGKRDLLEFLPKHFPDKDRIGSSYHDFEASLADDIYRHAVRNDDWDSAEILERVGFLTCSQARLFQFLEDMLHPVRRDQAAQDTLVDRLNPILRRDGYCLAASRKISGYPVYKVHETTATGAQPADALISRTLVSFDESGVHANWQKALERRTADPEGAITAAKTLLETV